MSYISIIAHIQDRLVDSQYRKVRLCLQITQQRNSWPALQSICLSHPHWLWTCVSRGLPAGFATKFTPDQYGGEACSATMDAWSLSIRSPSKGQDTWRPFEWKWALSCVVPLAMYHVFRSALSMSFSLCFLCTGYTVTFSGSFITTHYRIECCQVYTMNMSTDKLCSHWHSWVQCMTLYWVLIYNTRIV